MKKLLLLCCIILAVNFLHAQIALVAPQLKNQSYGFKSKIARPSVTPSNNPKYFTYISQLQKALKQNQPTIDNMPVVTGTINLTLRGNNNQGFEVYTATPDNMPVLKPDATFHSVMPIIGGTDINPLSKP